MSSKTDRRKVAINNRRKGHQAERYYAKVFRKLGFTFCKTARLASRMLDNCKIDLAFLPFNVQVKGGEHKGLNPSKILTNMRILLREKFPPYEAIHQYPNFVFHRKSIYSKSNDDDRVYMRKALFDLYRVKQPDLEALEYKTSKSIKSEFTELAVIDFKSFKDYIVPMYL